MGKIEMLFASITEADENAKAIEQAIDYLYLLYASGRMTVELYNKLCKILRTEKAEQEYMVKELQNDLQAQGEA